MFGLRFGIHYFEPFLVCNYLDGEETDGCFALIAFLDPIVSIFNNELNHH